MEATSRHRDRVRSYDARGHALILEDNPFNNFFASREMESIGYNTHAAFNFTEAIQLTETIFFSIILIDGDFSTAQSLVHTQNTIALLRDMSEQETVLLLMTNTNSDQLSMPRSFPGVAGVLAKPVTAEAVIAELIKIDGWETTNSIEATHRARSPLRKPSHFDSLLMHSNRHKAP